MLIPFIANIQFIYINILLIGEKHIIVKNYSDIIFLIRIF
jgi:hypothetical protein